MSNKLSQLHSFITQPHVKQDPFWRAVLQADSRSLFPKHELSKIELTKNHLNKLRLIMEHLPHFLALPLYAKQMNDVSKSTQEKEVKKGLESITKDFELYQQMTISSDYQFEVLELKEKVEQFCYELSRGNIRAEVREMLQRSEKWKEYLELHTRVMKKVDALLKEKEKCSLAQVVELERVDDCLTVGTAGKTIQGRLKEEIVMHRLKQVFAGCEYGGEIANDPCGEVWQGIVGQLNEPVCYV